jgi:hypothetical protein
MEGFEDKRRGFLKTLGLTVGGVMFAGASATAKIVEEKIKFPLSEDEQKFIDMYEVWMDNFIEVIKIQRNDPVNLENNKRIMVLTDESHSWQPQIIKYMKDTNFAKHYMIVSERMTKEIG